MNAAAVVLIARRFVVGRVVGVVVRRAVFIGAGLGFRFFVVRIGSDSMSKPQLSVRSKLLLAWLPKERSIFVVASSPMAGPGAVRAAASGRKQLDFGPARQQAAAWQPPGAR